LKPTGLPPSMQFGEPTLADWAHKKPKPKRAKATSSATWARALARATEMMAGGAQWSEAKPMDLVAAYARLHCLVYGAEDADLTARNRMRAAALASRAAQQLGGMEEAAAFLFWAWKREREREAFRRERGTGGGRITWVAQWSARLITDYRVDCARMG
jgi:hypothetical protein